MKFIFLFFLFSNFLFSQNEKFDLLVDSWHKAAAEANFNEYFNFMADNSVFIGTAPNERWSKNEFMKFSKPFFDKGKAWDFKPHNRNWSFSNDSLIAWFDEELDTWMEKCRGNGVLVFNDNQWKLVFYDLHVLIENEKIKEFILLRKNK